MKRNWKKIIEESFPMVLDDKTYPDLRDRLGHILIRYEFTPKEASKYLDLMFKYIPHKSEQMGRNIERLNLEFRQGLTRLCLAVGAFMSIYIWSIIAYDFLELTLIFMSGGLTFEWIVIRSNNKRIEAIKKRMEI